ncbi:MAG: hypothetical protein K2X39_04640 [Silvanigrellaceae bacterium]|nr:hypothetical protein [Silvanigrellaceae bacterium]
MNLRNGRSFEILHDGFGLHKDLLHSQVSILNAKTSEDILFPGKQKKWFETNFFKDRFVTFYAFLIDFFFAAIVFLGNLFIGSKYSVFDFVFNQKQLMSFEQKYKISEGLLILYLHTIHVWFFTCLFIFILQLVAIKKRGTTFGRSFFRIYPEKNSSFLYLDSIAIGLHEFLTLGGLLSFPFALLFPYRLPLFFWIKLSIKRE